MTAYTSATFSGVARRNHIRPSLLAAVACALLFGSLARLGSLQLNNLYEAKRLSVTQPIAVRPAAVKKAVNASARSAATSAAKPAPTPAASAAAAIPPACTPDTAYSAPGALDLADASPGLSRQIDPIHYYRIYGYDSDEVRQQIITCAPKLSGDNDDFTGYTMFNLSWRYDYVATTANQCALTNVKVGVHISEVLPSWHDSRYASTTFAGAWQSFVTDLNTHEQGHIALDEQYAATLLSDLQNIQAVDCTSVAAAATATVQRDVAALDAANVNYDAVTDHGATQGAILP